MSKSTPVGKAYQVVEIRIFDPGEPDGRYPIELRVPGWRDFPRVTFQLDQATLLSFSADPKEYGLYLGQALFAADALGPAYRETVAALQGQGKGLRLRLRIDPQSLQVLFWERLHHPLASGWEPLSLAGMTPFSRDVPAQEWERPEPIVERPLRILAVIASSEDLDMYSLDPITESEREAVHEVLSGLPEVGVTYLEANSDRLPTLNRLREELAGRYHIVYFLCHGAQTRRATVLYLENEYGGVDAVRDKHLVSAFKALAQPPQLCFFAACESAAQSKQDAFVPLAPALVAGGGVPAVIAMTDKVGARTAQDFTRQFFNQLLAHGQVDLAVNEARALVQDRWDWSVPVLFSRLPDNQLLALIKPGSERQVAPAEVLQTLLAAIKAVLLDCEEFDDSRQLKAVFRTSVLRPWRSRLPVADNPDRQVDFVIAYLENQYLRSGENALVLFLKVLSERYDPALERHTQLLDLAKQLEELKRS